MCAAEVVCSQRIVGWSIDLRMTSELADTALRTAIARRLSTATVIVHYDPGGQFRSRRFHSTLRAHGLAGSVERVGSAGDNVAIESFFVWGERTVLTVNPGPSVMRSAAPSSSGSKRPTTAAVVNAHSASSLQLSSRP